MIKKESTRRFNLHYIKYQIYYTNDTSLEHESKSVAFSYSDKEGTKYNSYIWVRIPKSKLVQRPRRSTLSFKLSFSPHP